MASPKAADSGSGAVELDTASTMDLHELLLQNRTRAIDEALEGLSRSALPHYSVDNAAQNRIRLERLYDLCTQCLVERSLNPIADHARQVAGERHREGIDLREMLDVRRLSLLTSKLGPAASGSNTQTPRHQDRVFLRRPVS